MFLGEVSARAALCCNRTHNERSRSPKSFIGIVMGILLHVLHNLNFRAHQTQSQNPFFLVPREL